jgi:DNA-binding MarR family transcriptional regulator
MSRYLIQRHLAAILGPAMKDCVDKLLEQWHEERPELDVSGLGLAVRIEMLAKLLRRSTGQSLAGVGLKTWQYDVLSALRRQGPPYELPVTELARASLLTSGAMTTRIDHLEAQGLVRRQRDPLDRRGVRVGLTPQGCDLVDAAIHARFMAAEKSVKGLDAQERLAVEAGLRKLLLSLRPTSAADGAGPLEATPSPSD